MQMVSNQKLHCEHSLKDQAPWLFITMFTDWIIKRFSDVSEAAKTNEINIFWNKHIVFVDKSH